MKVLVACEESQAVTKEFRKLGHEAYSCDLKDCSGGHPEWHIKGDALDNLKGYDFMGAHPVCKYLTNSGVGWLARKKPTLGFDWSERYQIYMNWDRYQKMIEGAEFFNKMLAAVKETGKGYVENPIMHKYAKEIITEPYTQIIQPYEYGHPESKATCLWVVGLPKLEPSDNVKHVWQSLPKKEAQRLHYLPPSTNRDELRSKTYTGIAKAIAEQWSE